MHSLSCLLLLLYICTKSVFLSSIRLIHAKIVSISPSKRVCWPSELLTIGESFLFYFFPLAPTKSIIAPHPKKAAPLKPPSNRVEALYNSWYETGPKGANTFFFGDFSDYDKEKERRATRVPKKDSNKEKEVVSMFEILTGKARTIPVKSEPPSLRL